MMKLLLTLMLPWKKASKVMKNHSIFFLVALRNVAEAHGGIGNLAKKTGMGRESLYKTLSEKGNPKWHTLVSLVIALGLNLRLS